MTVMMHNENCIEKYNNCKETIKEISKDSKNDEYMSESEYEIYNFDKVKSQYLKELKVHNECKSVDGLMILGKDKRYFLEFKNGRLEGEKEKENGKEISKMKLQLKIKASVSIYCDICKKYISDMRETDEFILVYNGSKNPSLDNIGKHFLGKADKGFIKFGLKRYKKLYFKDVHTYTKNEFEDFLNKVNKN